MINPIAFKLGPLTVHWYALCILTGLILAVYLASKEAPRKRLSSDDILDFILIAFPLAIIGARLYYVIFEWSYYAHHLDEIIAVWNGGIAIYGGLITGVIILLIYCYYKVLNPIHLLDVAAPGVMLAQAIGRWGNFINQEAYGKAVSNLDYLPSFIRQQMFIDGSYRIPTFLYESLWNFLGFILIMIWRRKPKRLLDGEIFTFYLIWYGFGRLVIEGMRTDSLMFLGIRVSQYVSVLFIIIGIIFVWKRRHQKGIPYYQE
ncbi:prolipoprotein diacylglyceryl transferase [Streptococcus castoreus]|uniref:prolipoprotein diacylglyceryl transferase n=1 Tax=Streptococcus castoreus TaxID=254786 RepID=UPI00041520FB|nr:prolipoprotein diacylglyceryl transferase [Streptococcus castoreus]